MGSKINVNLVKSFIRVFTVILNLLAVFVLKNDVHSLPYIGILIVLTSILMIIKYKKTNSLVLIIGIISLISISFAYSICFNTYSTAFNWQIPLIRTEENIINAKNFLLFITILSLSIGNIVVDNTKKDNNDGSFKYNPLIVIGCMIFLVYALIYGFDRGVIGVYTSNRNVIYEYALVVFIFAWKYS